MTTPTLETLAYRAPLALRCTRAGSGVAVASGLRATGWPVGNQTVARTARRSPVSGLLGFATLPGLFAQEYARAEGAGPVTFPPPAPVLFVVEVVDDDGRYLPQVFTVEVPVSAPVDVPLYEAPTLRVATGGALVAGQVRVAPTGAPAAWALVDVTIDGRTVTTMGDDQGRFLLTFAFPEALPPLSGSPPHGSGLADVTWPYSVAVRYQPGVLTWPAGVSTSGPPDRAGVQAQAAAAVLDGVVPRPSLPETLAYGVPQSLRLTVRPA